jgi:1-deoxy-D-xylulose-5-phosphate reductoisomerase
MASVKSISVLGSTGSIGRQALDVVDSFPDRFRVVALACRSSAEEIILQARRFRPQLVAVEEEKAAKTVRETLGRDGMQVVVGSEGIAQCAVLPGADIVVAAAAGVAGLAPVWEAVRAGKTVALANKEPLVVAGHLIVMEAARSGSHILPVDSEHSAIFQSLLGQRRESVARVLLTASGGAFRDLDQVALARVTPQQALAHPTWKMGPKVTVDSATLMNKGLELIEARWLFDLRPDMLDVVLHRESIVHSLVEFVDGSVIAHLARPDMRLPIQFALSYPERLPRGDPPPDLAELGGLHFERFDTQRWPCVGLARKAIETGGTAPAALNAGDEVAVEWFLQGKVTFSAIPRIIEHAVTTHEVGAGESVEELLAVDRRVRDVLEEGPARWTS